MSDLPTQQEVIDAGLARLASAAEVEPVDLAEALATSSYQPSTMVVNILDLITKSAYAQHVLATLEQLNQSLQSAGVDPDKSQIAIDIWLGDVIHTHLLKKTGLPAQVFTAFVQVPATAPASPVPGVDMTEVRS